MLRRLLAHFVLGLAAAAACAQPPSGENTRTPQNHPPFFSRVRGLFDIDLPDLDPPGTVKLILHPHVSDLLRRDYLRTDAGFRWALNSNFELSSEAATYLTHGLGGGSAGYGLGELRLGTKYIFSEWLRPDFETSVAFNVELPLGRPPVDLTDGHNHYTPSFVIQHHSDRHPRLTTFAGASLDLLGPPVTPGTFGHNQPHDDSFSVTAGAVLDAGQLKWTFSGTWATTALIGSHTGHFFYLRPSVLWYVPKKLTFNSKTQWIVGFGTPMTWGPDGYEFKVTTRLRAEITFRQVIDRMRQRARYNHTR